MFGLEKYRDVLGKKGQGRHSLRAGVDSGKEFAGLLVCGLTYALLGGYSIAGFLFISLILIVITTVAGSIAVFDTVGTILISAGLAKFLGVSFDWTFVALLLSAEFLHVLFGVHTP